MTFNYEQKNATDYYVLSCGKKFGRLIYDDNRYIFIPNHGKSFIEDELIEIAQQIKRLNEKIWEDGIGNIWEGDWIIEYLKHI